MRACRNCGGDLYSGSHGYQIDDLVCRACQKSPAVQIRVLLDRARDQDCDFDQAWRFALGEQVMRPDGHADFIGGRVRWPHDTNHRIEWKDILSLRKVRDTWRACYENEPPKKTEKTLAQLALAA